MNKTNIKYLIIVFLFIFLSLRNLILGSDQYLNFKNTVLLVLTNFVLFSVLFTLFIFTTYNFFIKKFNKNTAGLISVAIASILILIILKINLFTENYKLNKQQTHETHAVYFLTKNNLKSCNIVFKFYANSREIYGYYPIKCNQIELYEEMFKDSFFKVKYVVIDPRFFKVQMDTTADYE